MHVCVYECMNAYLHAHWQEISFFPAQSKSMFVCTYTYIHTHIHVYADDEVYRRAGPFRLAPEFHQQKSALDSLSASREHLHAGSLVMRIATNSASRVPKSGC
jgi:hypothetical protein